MSKISTRDIQKGGEFMTRVSTMGHETKSHLSNMMMKNMSTKTPKNLMMTMEVRILMTQNSMMPQMNPFLSLKIQDMLVIRN